MTRLRHLLTFYGPNPFAPEPVVVAAIDLPFADSDNAALLRQGCITLRDVFPDWISRAPSPASSVGECVGETLVQWALGALNEVRGFLHESGSAPSPDGALLWIGFHQPEVSMLALKLALDLLERAGRKDAPPLSRSEPGIDSLWQLCRMHHPDYQAQIIMQGARSKGIPFMQFIPGTKYWQFGWGCRSRIFFESMSNADGSMGMHFSNSKSLGKSVFNALGFPTPPFVLVNSPDELADAAVRIGWPCVIKPLSCGKGKGVIAGIKNMTELESAFFHARKYSSGPVMVEGFVTGDDYRLLVFDGKFFGALRRDLPYVIGDGKSSLRQLIGKINESRTQSLVKSRYLCPIPIDAALELHLAQQEVGLESVPQNNRRITLRSNANISTGGTGTDVSGIIHPDVKQMAESVAKTMGLSIVGIDYITEDIETSWRHGGALIESNITPGIDGLIAAGQNAVDLACAVLGDLPGRIPFHLVVVEQGSLGPAAERLKEMQFHEGLGWTCGSETRIGTMSLLTKEGVAWAGMHALLRNRVVSELLAVCSAEEIMRNGMPADRIDRISLCGELPFIEEWMEVLEKHCGTPEKFSDWEECCRKL